MSAPDARHDIAELVLFSVGNLLCGLDIRSVQEINKQLEITPVPHAPEYVRGIVNLRGQLLTVVDLRCKLGLHPASSIDPDMRILVVRGPDGIVGLLVDRVADVIEIDGEDLEPPPGHIDKVPGAYFYAVHKMEGELAAVLHLTEVLAT